MSACLSSNLNIWIPLILDFSLPHPQITLLWLSIKMLYCEVHRVCEASEIKYCVNWQVQEKTKHTFLFGYYNCPSITVLALKQVCNTFPTEMESFPDTDQIF